MLLLERYGHTDEFRGALLHACTHHLPDETDEDVRADYLWGLIRRTGDERWYRDRILAVLCSLDEESNPADIEQVFETACLFAERGDEQVHQAMRETFRRVPTFGGAHELITLDGVDAFVAVVEAFLGSDGEQMVHELYLLVGSLGDRVGEEVAWQSVSDTSSKRADLRSTLQAVQAHRAQSEKVRPVIRSYADIQREINGKHPPLLLRWGKQASDEELERVAADLLTEDEPERQRAYLTAFAWRRFPLPPEKLLEFAQGDNEKLARWACRALRYIKDDAVRELGLRLLRSAERCDMGLDLLTSNFRDDDLGLIEALAARADLPNYHSFGIAARQLFEANPSADAVPTLMSLYENVPCSMCRGSVVKDLIARGALEDWMRDECRYDAYGGTRELIDGTPG